MITLPSSGQTPHNRLYSSGTKKVRALVQEVDVIFKAMVCEIIRIIIKKKEQTVWTLLIMSEHKRLTECEKFLY